MKQIQSRENPFFKSLKRLAESGRERYKTGQTLLDGLHLVEAYEAAFGSVESLIVSESALETPEISRFVEGRDSVQLSNVLMRDLGLVAVPSGLLGLVRIPSVNLTVNHEIDAILLDNIQDPGNVGTLLRTAAAAGIKQALLSPGCAAAWSPKVLRAGQGAHFALTIHEAIDLAGFMANYRGSTAVTTLADASSLYEAKWHDPLAWIFGSEGQGVRPELSAAAQLKIRIPMPGAVESLNVAAAAAICLFEALRRRLSADSRPAKSS